MDTRDEKGRCTNIQESGFEKEGCLALPGSTVLRHPSSFFSATHLSHTTLGVQRLSVVSGLLSMDLRGFARDNFREDVERGIFLLLRREGLQLLAG